MTDSPLGFGIEESSEGFILRHGEVEMRMSKEEFFSLKIQMSFWTDRILSEFQARTGEVKSLVTYPIAQGGVWMDAIQENVLLTLTTTGGTDVTFSLPIPLAKKLAEALPHVLSLIRPSPMA